MSLATSNRIQSFPIVDFITRRQIGIKPRSEVHRSGLWHEGVQAFIIRTVGTKIQTLVQRRSGITDISSGKLDQSLATQALIQDHGNLERTLKRGLLEELDIAEDEVRFIRIGKEGWLRVSKKYEEDPSLFNREFISLFIVQLADEARVVTPASPKIQNIYWQDWEDFARSVQARPNDFTKTSRFYVLNKPILSSIQRAIKHFLEGKDPPPFPFSRSAYYSYAQGPDVFINKYGDYGRASIEIMDIEQQASRMFFKPIRSFDIYDSQSQPSPTLRFTLDSGDNFIWREGSAHPSPRKALPLNQNTIAEIDTRFRQETDQMRTRAEKTSWNAQIDDLYFKIHSNLSRIRSRIDAGDVFLLPQEDALPQENHKKLVILAMPGTFDPPHLSHIDLMLEAFAHASEIRRENPASYVGFLAPLGEYAPGPNGQARWKANDLPSALRHDLSESLTRLFSPLIQTSSLSLEHPKDYGTQAALRLINLFSSSFPAIDFRIVAGSETFCRWHHNFADLLGRYEEPSGADVNLGVITFDDSLHPVERIISKHGYKQVSVIKGFRNLDIHSRLFRETGDLTLLTQDVREKYLTFGERLK